MSRRICLGLDLKDDPDLIKQYKNYHRSGNVWPEIIQSLYDSGIENMEIYLSGNRLFMILEVNDSFTLERKAKMDADNKRVQEWEALMQSKFQQALPWEKELKWVPMERVFYLE